jgi:2-oxoglutarate dehydrogenase E1 component
LTTGRFQPVLDDAAATPHDTVRRLILCSGKMYYDLTLAPARAQARQVAIARVELLYPFPREELATLIRGYPGLREIVWVQEEPRNMGPQKFMLPQLREIVGPDVTVRDIGRPERSSPAEGYPAAHQVEQARIVATALSV